MMQPYTQTKPDDPRVEAALDRLATTPMTELRNRYRVLFRTDPPTAFGPDLLRRSVAHRIQTKAHSELSPSTQRLLDQLVRTTGAKVDGNEVSRRIKSGSEIVRTWKGKSYRVTVMHDGFAYDGRIYLGLSEIASLITGTRWNGPRFFGLRSKPNMVSADGR